MNFNNASQNHRIPKSVYSLKYNIKDCIKYILDAF